jgi:nucleoside phosphorylase
MNHVRLLILTAVLPEARALARAFSLREPAGSNNLHFMWLNEDLVLTVVGIRARNLEQVAAAVGTFDGVIMAGLGGALSPALRIGDVVVDARGAQGVLPGLGSAFLGRVHTSNRIVSTAQDKRRLFESNGCLAVDMETEIVAEFATARGAAFVGVRGISDTADEPLDPALLALVDDAPSWTRERAGDGGGGRGGRKFSRMRVASIYGGTSAMSDEMSGS